MKTSMPLTTPGLVLALDGVQGKSCPAFDLSVCWTILGREQSLMAFISCKARNPTTFKVKSEIQSKQHIAARELIRGKCIELGIVPIFVHITTGSAEGIDSVLEELAKEGEDDLLVLAGDKLLWFLPLLQASSKLRLDT
ncbi:hypothetical protein WJX73_007582 [Symbiochloris irregularis]|uniref:Uncharacterized protein n=1 Tax=Symbiochloris irregularis TaxID=706552 RepID=A0AAW1P598_9CHLO